MKNQTTILIRTITYITSLLGKSQSIKLIKTSGLLSLVALILFSCEETNEIGQEFINNKDKVGVFRQSIPVSSHQILLDSINSNSDRILFGNYNDPEFGTITAEAYSDVLPVFNDLPEIASDAVFDSLIFSARVIYYYGNDLESDFSFSVHQLLDSMQTLKDSIIVNENGENDTIQLAANYSRTRQGYEPEPLGQSSIVITEDLIDQDSVFSLRLSDELGQDLLDRAKSGDPIFDDNKNFLGFIKGFALVADPGSKAIVGINVESTSTVASLHYHSAQDTSQLNFRLASFQYSFIEGNRMGTALEGLSFDDQYFQPADDQFYAQSGTGIIPVIMFDRFKEFADSVGNLVINSAKMEIHLEPSTQPYLQPPSGLVIFASDSTQNIIQVSAQFGGAEVLTLSSTGDVTQSRNPFSIALNEDIIYLDVTLLMQNQLVDDYPFDRLLLYPNTVGLSGNTPFSSAIDRVVFDETQTKIVVHYTTIR